jgi:hypothetical protein
MIVALRRSRIMAPVAALLLLAAAGCSVFRHPHQTPSGRSSAATSSHSPSRDPSANSPVVDYYTFRLSSFEVLTTRSGSAVSWLRSAKDSDRVAFSLKVGDVDYPAQVVGAGDHEEGDVVPVNLIFSDIPVPRSVGQGANSTPIRMTYQVVNFGNVDNAVADEAMRQAGDYLADLAVDYLTYQAGVPWASEFLQPLAHELVDYTVKLVDPNCDGPVAIDSIRFDAADLYSATGQAPQAVTERRTYDGTKSADGCGPNSLYAVTWSVERASFSSVAYDLGVQLAIGAYNASYQQYGIMDQVLRDDQRLADLLRDSGILPTPSGAGDLYGYVHGQMGTGSNSDDAFGALHDELISEMNSATGRSTFGDMFDLGWYVGLAEAQCTAPLDNWVPAKQLVLTDLQAAQSLISQKYPQTGFDVEALAGAINMAGFATALTQPVLYAQVQALRFAFDDTVRGAFPNT